MNNDMRDFYLNQTIFFDKTNGEIQFYITGIQDLSCIDANLYPTLDFVIVENNGTINRDVHKIDLDTKKIIKKGSEDVGYN